MVMILIILLIIMFLVFPDFRQNWLLSYRWIEKQESDDSIIWKVLAGLGATFVAPVITIFNSIKNQLVNRSNELGASEQPMEPTPQERYNTFTKWFDYALIADWNADKELKNLVYGRTWFNGNLVVHFHNRPNPKKLKELEERFKSYGTSSGWTIRDFGNLYLHNFETFSKWSVQVIFADKIAENHGLRVAELARVEREKERDVLPISLLNHTREEVKEKTKGKFPLWANRKGHYQFIELNSHMVLVGSTGAGKTGTLTYWLCLIDNLKNNQDELFILDYKRGKDWYPFYTSKNYASAEDTKVAWDKLYHQFKLYQTGVEDISDKVVYIIIDELSSLVESYTTKKERDEFLRQFKDMLRLSRSLGAGRGGYRLIVGLQQADSTYFGGTEGRGNLGIRVALGGVTTEGVRMVFEITDESDKPESSPAGKGFAQIHGEPVRRIMIPYIKDRELVLNDIAKRYSN